MKRAVGVSSTSVYSYLINKNFDVGSMYVVSILQEASVTLKITVFKSELQLLAEN